MLLRSSSTPILGSLLSSFSDSPITTSETTSNHAHNKLSFHQSGSHNVSSFSHNSSPSDFDQLPFKGLHRAQSEGSLEGLAHNYDEFYNSNPPAKFSRNCNFSVLQTIPSFSFYNSGFAHEDDDDEEEGRDEVLEGNDKKGVMNMEGTGFRAEEYMINNKKNGFWNLRFEEERESNGGEMYLAKGLGVEGGGYGGGVGGGFSSGNSGRDGDGDGNSVEEYYKQMVKENPGNSMVLRNYAQFLYQSKGDLEGAEEYYSRAILADPKDGEVMSQYAKLVWELHHDHYRASSYFEHAALTAPEDSHVLAAFAGFLWETEEDEEENVSLKDFDGSHFPPQLHEGAVASTSA